MPTAVEKKSARVSHMSCRGIPAASGVYLIRNTDTGDCYVGASKNIRHRIETHRGQISSGQAPASLMRAFSAEYRGKIVVSVLELCPLGILAAREVEWIREICPTCNKRLKENAGRPGVVRDERTEAHRTAPLHKPQHQYVVYADDFDARIRVWAEDEHDAIEQGALLFECAIGEIIARYVKSVSR